jgi:hypothetical protein
VGFYFTIHRFRPNRIVHSNCRSNQERLRRIETRRGVGAGGFNVMDGSCDMPGTRVSAIGSSFVIVSTWLEAA